MSRNSTPVTAHGGLQEASERSPTAVQDPGLEQTLSPSQLETEAVDGSNFTQNSSIEDQNWSETKCSGSTVSLLRSVKPLKLNSTTTCKPSSYRNDYFSPRSATSDLQSTLTSSSELEFRKDLASLDADIARLQMQFRVAGHPEHTPHDH